MAQNCYLAAVNSAFVQPTLKEIQNMQVSIKNIFNIWLVIFFSIENSWMKILLEWWSLFSSPFFYKGLCCVIFLDIIQISQMFISFSVKNFGSTYQLSFLDLSLHILKSTFLKGRQELRGREER